MYLIFYLHSIFTLRPLLGHRSFTFHTYFIQVRICINSKQYLCTIYTYINLKYKFSTLILRLSCFWFKSAKVYCITIQLIYFCACVSHEWAPIISTVCLSGDILSDQLDWYPDDSYICLRVENTIGPQYGAGHFSPLLFHFRLVQLGN